MYELSNFDSIQIGLASPEKIREWSYGEVLKPETINYRTQKPERDGLFCERIFGPVRDWECHCGRYKRLRYKGVICEKCGVEVTRSKVRRERMGHIELACPVTHIWYLRGVPSKIGNILDIPLKELEQVVYLVNLMVMDPASVDLMLVKDADFVAQLTDKVAGENIVATKSEEILIAKGEIITEEIAKQIEENGIKVVKLEDQIIFAIPSETKELLTKTSKVVVDADKYAETLPFGEDLQSLMDAAKAGKISKEEVKEKAIAGIIADITGSIALEDIKAPKSEDIIVAANQVISAEAAKAIAESKISNIRVVDINKEIVGKILYDDIIDEESGEVLFAANSKISEEDVHKIVALGIKECRYVTYNKEINNKVLYTDLEDKETHKIVAIEQTQFNKDLFESIVSLGINKIKINKFDNMRKYQVVSPIELQEFQASCSREELKGFRTSTGAEAIKELLVDLKEKKFSDGEEKLAKYVDFYRHQVAVNGNKSNSKDRKRLEILEAFHKSGNKPEWMVLDVIPVLPPDLRPMVQLDGGRFATSDLNDLYRRLINRNNRLKRMKEQGAPEIMLRNEKRMLQEIVDALIDNGRRGKPFVGGSSKRELKSLSAYLRGKQGRFRQNLLGKRVDYSGRSVIVVGPELKLYQCGLPKEMALELFKPFIMNKLTERGICTNIKIAKRYVETSQAVVWDILEEIIKDHPVLLNRAPTLHRLGIQAFEPVLVEGRAIKLHPLACTAFNADFDGDQMAVHVPLSIEAQAEARILMLCTNNILKLSDGKPVVCPTQDMVMGAYYLTIVKPGAKGEGNFYSSMDEAVMAYNDHDLTLQSLCYIKVKYVDAAGETKTKLLHTTLGRFLYNETIPQDLQFVDRSKEENEGQLEIEGILGINGMIDQKQFKVLVDTALAKSVDKDKIRGIVRNRLLDDKSIDKIVAEIKEYKANIGEIVISDVGEDIATIKLLKGRIETILGAKAKAIGKNQISLIIDNCFKLHGATETAEMLDRIKAIGYKYSTIGSITTSVFDMNIPAAKKESVEEAEKAVQHIEKLYARGILSDGDRYKQIIKIWKDTTDNVEKALKDQGEIDLFNPIWMMAKSGARGNMGQIRQLSGMRGLMSDPSGRTIELPVRSSFREGLSVLEYFISSHGGRKGLVDTALKTADSGYLTRRLVDVSHSVIVCEKDCGDSKGTFVTAIRDNKGPIEKLADRISGRYTVGEVVDPRTGEILCEADTLIDYDTAVKIDKVLTGYWEEEGKNMHKQPGVWIRSILTCKTKNGVCVKCYGKNMASGNPVKIGEAVGIIAAQSIGEPGTQLTMRTFHSGGVASEDDITQGLPRVEELFEARNPKGAAVITENSGEVEISKDRREIKVAEKNENGQILDVKSYQIPYNANILVNDGDIIEAGDQLTKGSINPQTMLRIKGVRGVQEYIAKEVQSAYRTSSVEINDKHVEVIVRQMLRKVLIEEQGDTSMIPGTYVDIFSFETENEKVLEKEGTPATAKRVLLGITKSALATESFLSAASFQETPKALADAAINNKVDPLLGLKENVIIGKLIPAGTGMKCYQNITTVSAEEPKIVEMPSMEDMFDIEETDNF